MAGVRYATIADVPGIVAMGLRFLRESSFGSMIAENPDQMARLATKLVEGEMDGVLYVAVDDTGASVGMVGGLHYVHPISAEPMVTELFWYCDPTARGTTGVRLLKALEKWATKRGALALQMIAPMDSDRVMALYQAMSYVPVEVAWQKRLTPQPDLEAAVTLALNGIG